MFEILDEVCTPKRATKYSAYVDLFAREDVVIGAGETKIVPLGIKINPDFFIYVIGGVDIDAGGHIINYGDSAKIEQFMKSHYLEIAIRSSLAAKGLIIANGIGIVDLDYQDEIGLIVHNHIAYVFNEENEDLSLKTYSCTDREDLIRESFAIRKGHKVAQCTIKEHKSYLMGYKSEVVRDGGFGSTGK